MTDAKDVGFDYVEVKVSKKVTITLSPRDLLALSQEQGKESAGTVEDAPQLAAERPGKLSQLGKRLKDAVLGRGQPPKDSG